MIRRENVLSYNVATKLKIFLILEYYMWNWCCSSNIICKLMLFCSNFIRFNDEIINDISSANFHAAKIFFLSFLKINLMEFVEFSSVIIFKFQLKNYFQMTYSMMDFLFKIIIEKIRNSSLSIKEKINIWF